MDLVWVLRAAWRISANAASVWTVVHVKLLTSTAFRTLMSPVISISIFTMSLISGQGAHMIKYNKCIGPRKRRDKGIQYKSKGKRSVQQAVQNGINRQRIQVTRIR